jgi:hypothetical protein
LSEINYDDLDKLLGMNEEEIDAAFTDDESLRQSQKKKAEILKKLLYSVQHNPYDGQGKRKPSTTEHLNIQDMTSLRSDINSVFSYVIENEDPRLLIMLLDVSTQIITSVAELLIELSYNSEKFKDWILKESSFLINNTVQLIYREMHDKESPNPP